MDKEGYKSQGINKEYNQDHNETKEKVIMKDTIHTNQTTYQNHIQGGEDEEKITRRPNKRLYTLN